MYDWTSDALVALKRRIERSEEPVRIYGKWVLREKCGSTEEGRGGRRRTYVLPKTGAVGQGVDWACENVITTASDYLYEIVLHIG